jgi:biopolymer transport protein TolR
MLNRRPRRQINQMNVVPYIDVMLVLLVIFMITTPMFSPGVIDVPSVSKARTPDVQPVEVILDGSGSITLKTADSTRTFASAEELEAAVGQLGQSEQPFAISAAQDMKYADVLKVADSLHKAGIRRVALTVKQNG